MGAVKKYCNKAVLIENGLVKAIGNPDDVANQYSLDNATETKAMNEGFQVENAAVSDLKVKLLHSPQISPEQEIEFEISYQVNQDLPTYVSFSLTDIDRTIWLYNDNSMDQPTEGPGQKRLTYTCPVTQINNAKLKLQVSVRDQEEQILAFADSQNNPVILVNRQDIKDDDVSAKDSATGLIQRNGSWKISQS